MPSGNFNQRNYWENLSQIEFNLNISRLRQDFEISLRYIPQESDDSLREKAIQLFNELMDDAQAYSDTIMSHVHDNQKWYRDDKHYKYIEQKRELANWFYLEIESFAVRQRQDFDLYALEDLRRMKDRFMRMIKKWDEK